MVLIYLSELDRVEPILELFPQQALARRCLLDFGDQRGTCRLTRRLKRRRERQRRRLIANLRLELGQISPTLFPPQLCPLVLQNPIQNHFLHSLLKRLHRSFTHAGVARTRSARRRRSGVPTETLQGRKAETDRVREGISEGFRSVEPGRVAPGGAGAVEPWHTCSLYVKTKSPLTLRSAGF